MRENRNYPGPASFVIILLNKAIPGSLGCYCGLNVLTKTQVEINLHWEALKDDQAGELV